MKYALGTIVGTALLGLAKSKGSKVKLAKGKVLAYGAFDPLSLPPILYNPHPKITPPGFAFKSNPDPIMYTFKTITPIQNCKGNPNLNEYMNSEDFFEKSKEEQDSLREIVKSHAYCIRDKNQCVSLGAIDTTLVKKVALEILDLNSALEDNNLYIMRINNKRIPLVFFSNFNRLYEFILERIEEADRVSIKLGYIDPHLETPIVYPGDVLSSKKEIIKKMEEINKKMINHIRGILYPFSFSIYSGSLQYIKLIYGIITINEYITDTILIQTKTGEWVPYNKPESKSNLRLR